ncbi:unnamed protein product [Clonostachys rosea]|uniref:Uncharacterized protein n=1 Tax=Bionectria ochroleuca TaxID=29856 RepID=A0ABY6UM69_BIOOC|nr:unnamed protein product [Clonostachys rosea]
MDRINLWKSEGRLQPSYILDHMGEGSEHFDSAWWYRFDSKEGELTEDEFTSLLLAEGGLPPSCHGLGRFVYQMIAYLSHTPFYPPAGQKPRATITITEIYRGLAWLIPDLLRGGSTIGRARTLADERRHLFQSLATTTHDGTRDPVADRQRAHRNAFFMPEPQYEENGWLGNNYCDDGDEMFHDVLDTLFFFQYDVNRYIPYGRVRRETFRETAKELIEEKDRFRLYSLAIPLDDLTTFLGFMLAMQFEWEEGASPELALFNDAATELARSFCHDPARGVTWPEFDDILPQVPFLFDPLQRLIAAAFMGPLPMEVSYSDKAPTPPKDTSMTLPRLSQLASMVNLDVDFEDFKRAHQWYKGVRPCARVLSNAMRSMPGQNVMVVRGWSPSGGESIVGIFNPPEPELETRKREDDLELGPPADLDDAVRRELIVTRQDAVRDRLEYQGHIACPVRPHVFVLKPAQRMVRFEGGPRVEGDCLRCGDALEIRNDGLVSIRVGDLDIRSKATKIEVWGETARPDSGSSDWTR